MKSQFVFPACALLLWTLAAFVSCDGGKNTALAGVTNYMCGIIFTLMKAYFARSSWGKLNVLNLNLSSSFTGTSDNEIQVIKVSDGIKVSCPSNYFIESKNGTLWQKEITLSYIDESTGEYTCVENGADPENVKKAKIFVKFRTCDNCVELTPASVVGMAIGDVVATIVIGVAVYLIASHAQTTPMASRNKSSDRQHLVSNEGSRSSNDHYQRLTPRRGQKDMYDVINTKR